ncbi:Uncharacterised protein [Legionella wadsworthii]|uniref:Uncharacterized protein n=1 Tax=Legionella wadsworthii TaxID=28088 RepID=A0A378LUM6_9GAMM|nr:hypothetical protein [Legionella wadsworthii]STY29529.1 Uncharacterised protein [Legionella wadsworthii]
MRIDFSLLRLLHLYNYQKVKGEQCPLELFKRKINPIELSTCMRHLYLFNESQFEPHAEEFKLTLEQLKTPRLHQKPIEFDALQGAQVYQFLLYWVIGGLNNKKPFDDERILGSVRAICRNYELSLSSIKRETWEQNQPVILALLSDAKHLLKLTKMVKLPLEEKKALLKKVCERCTWVRDLGFFEITPNIDYRAFIDQEDMMVHLYNILKLARIKTDLEFNKISTDEKAMGFVFSSSKDRLREKLQKIEQLQEILIREEPSLKKMDESYIQDSDCKAH